MSLTGALDTQHGGRAVARPDIPQAVKGRYRSVKTVLTSLMLAYYFLTPFLRWDRGPTLPDQAILFDLPGRRLFIFGLEFWPQDLPIAVGLLIASALALFYVTTLAGRVWCGFACPQTVWSDLLFSVDRLIARFTGRGAHEKALRLVVWLVISVLTAYGFAAWFNDAITLPGEVLSGTAPAGVYVTILVLTTTTFFFAAYARERVCLHMCPWPRFQSALLDQESLVVTYQAWRGEPRGKKRLPLRPEIAEPGLAALAREAADLGGQLKTRGDCIDCTRCVTACPTGVDIRKGLQFGCIGCGMCVDACNDVMTRLERPKGLIRFDSETNFNQHTFKGVGINWLRPKAMLFGIGALIALACALYGVVTLPGAVVHVDHQRNPPFVLLSDGSVRNDYSIRLQHRLPELSQVSLRADGLPGAELRFGAEGAASSGAIDLPVGADRTVDDRLHLTLPRGTAPNGRKDFDFVVEANGQEVARIESYFWGPQR